MGVVQFLNHYQVPTYFTRLRGAKGEAKGEAKTSLRRVFGQELSVAGRSQTEPSPGISQKSRIPTLPIAERVKLVLPVLRSAKNGTTSMGGRVTQWSINPQRT